MSFGSWLLSKLGATPEDSRVQLCTIPSGSHFGLLKDLVDQGIDVSLHAESGRATFITMSSTRPSKMLVFVPLSQLEDAQGVLARWNQLD